MHKLSDQRCLTSAALAKEDHLNQPQSIDSCRTSLARTTFDHCRDHPAIVLPCALWLVVVVSRMSCHRRPGRPKRGSERLPHALANSSLNPRYCLKAVVRSMGRTWQTVNNLSMSPFVPTQIWHPNSSAGLILQLSRHMLIMEARKQCVIQAFLCLSSKDFLCG